MQTTSWKRGNLRATGAPHIDETASLNWTSCSQATYAHVTRCQGVNMMVNKIVMTPRPAQFVTRL
jgi:hypothetical protein